MMDDEEFIYEDPDSGSGDEESDAENDYFPIHEPMVTSSQTRDSSKQTVKSSTSQSNTTSNDCGQENFEYVVLSPDDIVKYMVECIKEVNEVIKLPLTTVRLLLHHFRWDKEKLMERFYDPDHQDELFCQARIVNPFRNSSSQPSQRVQRVSSSTNSSSRQTLNKLCPICCAEKAQEQMTGHECGHSFCKDCWRIYLRIKIMDEGVGQTIPCPGKCDILVDDKLVLTLINEENIRRKYQHLITNSFVECNRSMRWCPGKNCTNAIKAPYCDVAKVQCTSCQTSFCFQCGLPWHEPIKCKWLRKWHKKCHDDSETSNWIAAHTKECPKCQATIEKNGGCNHLICKNQSCKYEFCWVCLGLWEPHGSSWYNCNRFNEDESKKARDDQERSRAALQRYLHYYKRYHNHYESLRFENKLLEEVNKRMESMQQHMSWIEVQFLKNACITLRQCRETLMYTYPFAFYLKKNNHSIIFEQNQADLEHATELLSGFLERDSVDATNLSQLKLKVQDKSSYCSTRRKVLLDHVAEGYDKDYWEYQDDI